MHNVSGTVIVGACCAEWPVLSHRTPCSDRDDELRLYWNTQRKGLLALAEGPYRNHGPSIALPRLIDGPRSRGARSPRLETKSSTFVAITAVRLFFAPGAGNWQWLRVPRVAAWMSETTLGPIVC